MERICSAAIRSLLTASFITATYKRVILEAELLQQCPGAREERRDIVRGNETRYYEVSTMPLNSLVAADGETLHTRLDETTRE